MILSSYEIEVPLSSLQPFELMVTPYTTEDRLRTLSAMIDSGSALPSPAVRSRSGRFEVLTHWDRVHLELGRHADPGNVKIRVLHGEYTDSQALRLSIIDQARIVGLGWLEIAQSLARAKKTLGWTDAALAKATGQSRSTVARQIKIATSLHPTFLRMAGAGRLHYDHCRRLVTLTQQRQAAIESEARLHHWEADRIMAAALGPLSPPSPEQGSANPGHLEIKDQPAPSTAKSMELKRLEVEISEKLGYPVTISPTSEDEKQGQTTVSFFDRGQFIGAVKALAKGFGSAQGSIRGHIALEYRSLDDFEEQFGHHLRED